MYVESLHFAQNMYLIVLVPLTQLEKAVADLREAFAVVEVSSPNFVATFLEKVVRRCAIEEDEAKVDRGVKKLLSRWYLKHTAHDDESVGKWRLLVIQLIHMSNNHQFVVDVGDFTRRDNFLM